MKMTHRESDEATIGELYEVSGEDCCLAFEFESRLVDVEIVDTDYIGELKFENGVTVYRTDTLKLKKIQTLEELEHE